MAYDRKPTWDEVVKMAEERMEQCTASLVRTEAGGDMMRGEIRFIRTLLSMPEKLQSGTVDRTVSPDTFGDKFDRPPSFI